MANVLVDEASLQNIASAIREKGGTGSYYPSEMASAINNICNNNVAFADNGSFWSALQSNGTRTNYKSIFKYFTDSNFKPQYNMVPTDATYMFLGSKITDLTALLDNARVKLDMSKLTVSPWNMFKDSTITRCPRFILPSNSTLSLITTFHNCSQLVTIDGMYTTVGNSFNQTFYGCTSLQNIIFEEGSEIGSDISFAVSPLSRESIESIINALSNDVTGKALTLKETAVRNAFEFNQINSINMPDDNTVSVVVLTCTVKDDGNNTGLDIEILGDLYHLEKGYNEITIVFSGPYQSDNLNALIKQVSETGSISNIKWYDEHYIDWQMLRDSKRNWTIALV
jgi:hypothetical protein